MVDASGRSYLITGASSGLGAEMAVQLARRGDRVALLARRRDRLDEVVERAAAAAREAGVAEPLRPLAFPADVADREAALAAVREADAALPGGIEVAVLNAGIGRDVSGARFDADIAARVIEVNLLANVHLLGELLPRMVERGRGHVVGVSSLAAYRGLPGVGPYSASKAGFSALLESLRVDLRPHGVAVTTVSPGFVRTELTAKNKHAMPFLLEVPDAAARIIRGMDRRKREVRFPLPLALAVRVLRALPDPLYDLAASRMRRGRRKPAAPRG